MKRFGLHSAIWATASTHFIVDAYGNMFAPLLPLLIPQLGLSLKTVGVLAMCYQLASSVSQLGFGTLADRWRPRVLLMAGPVLSVVVLSAIGTATSRADAGRRVARRRTRRRRVSSAGRRAGACRVGRSQGPRDVDAHLGRLARVSVAPLVFAPAVVALGSSMGVVGCHPGTARADATPCD